MTDINEYDHSHEAAVMGGSKYLGLDGEALLKRIEQARIVPDVSGHDVGGRAVVDLAMKDTQNNL